MLNVVAVEVLLFLSRRDLDKMCAVSKRLEALMALVCGTYPCRRLCRVHLRMNMREDNLASIFDVSIVGDEGREFAFQLFETFDEALAYLAPFYRRSYVDKFQVELAFYDGHYRLSPRQWSDLANIFRSGAARHLWLQYVDLSIIDDNAFVDVGRCRKLEVSYCEVRGKLLSDDVLRSFAANGVLDLQMCFNKSADENTVSEDALLEFCFPPSGLSRAVEVDNLAATSDTFVVKFFERLLAPAGTSRPRGFLAFNSKKEQRGLAAYAQHLLADQADLTYRFPTLRDGHNAYHFVIDYTSTQHRIQMEFSFGHMDLRPVTE